ncbi:MAG TPA: DUF924 family protein [Eoetvoesiella sp.]
MQKTKNSEITPDAASVITFWREAGPSLWFAKNTAFDETFRQRFLALHFAAARREQDAWLSSPYASLALVLLLDQFPRNAFRGTAHMYATDSLARYYAQTLIDSGFMGSIDDELKVFACVPFSHSESLDDQAHALDLYTKHAPRDMKWAVEHYEIIQRFGRFPHRNGQLGRLTTPEEQQFLDGGGFAG